jgi:hypothetical protein
LAAAIAFVLTIPNLLWQLDHGWASVRWFVNPPPSATDESRPQYIGNVLLLTGLVSLPVAVAGVRMLVRDRVLRPFGWTVIATVLAYFALGGKSYYALPAVLFALAAGAVPLDRWATPRRLRRAGVAFVTLLVVLLPVGLPVLPVTTADDLGIMKARTDYADELGWHQLARTTEGMSRGANVVITANYGEAGALTLFGRQAVLVGFQRSEAGFCRGDYRVVAHIQMPVDNDERGLPIARCTLSGSLAQVWPRVLRAYD